MAVSPQPEAGPDHRRAWIGRRRVVLDTGTCQMVSFYRYEQLQPGNRISGPAIVIRSVSAGNVETSQRIVDVLPGALAQACPDRVPAASQGTMNNLTAGGWDAPRSAP